MRAPEIATARASTTGLRPISTRLRDARLHLGLIAGARASATPRDASSSRRRAAPTRGGIATPVVRRRLPARRPDRAVPCRAREGGPMSGPRDRAALMRTRGFDRSFATRRARRRKASGSLAIRSAEIRCAAGRRYRRLARRRRSTAFRAASQSWRDRGFRGSLVPAFDLGALLGYPPPRPRDGIVTAATIHRVRVRGLEGHLRVVPGSIEPALRVDAPLRIVRAVAATAGGATDRSLPSLIEAIATRALRPRSERHGTTTDIRTEARRLDLR